MRVQTTVYQEEPYPALTLLVSVPSQQSHPYRPVPPAIVNKSNIKTYTKRKPEQDMEPYRKATRLCLNGTPPQTPEKGMATEV